MIENHQKTIDLGNIKYSINDKEKIACVIGCNKSINDIYIPRSIKYESKEFIVTSIFSFAFQDYKNLKKIEFSNESKLQIIGCHSFDGTSIESIKIPSSVTEIGNGSFYLCKKLQKIEINEDSNLQKIGSEAFYSTLIEEITIPSKLI